MDPALTTAAISAATGAIAGGVVSIATPWSQWGVEKRRIRFQRRQQQIDQWRQGIAAHIRDGHGSNSRLVQQPWYTDLAVHVTRRLDEERYGWRRHLPRFARELALTESVRQHLARDPRNDQHNPASPPIYQDTPPGALPTAGVSLRISVAGEANDIGPLVSRTIEGLARRWHVD